MAKQSNAQKETVERVMHEFKHGDLRIRGTGPKVKNPKQAIAIALHEAGASNQESPKEKREDQGQPLRAGQAAAYPGPVENVQAAARKRPRRIGPRPAAGGIPAADRS